MSFGFQSFDENGGLALDDKSFSIIGRDVVLSGKGSFPLYPEFVALGVSGAELVGKGLHWHISSNSVVYEVTTNSALTAVVFEYNSKSVANPIMGMEIFNESGIKTFSSGDKHFEVISTMSTRSTISRKHSETLDRKVVYILHSLFTYQTGVFPIGGTSWGLELGVDSLSATSTSLVLASYRTARLPYEAWEVGLTEPQRTSQLLRVRAK